MQTIQYAEDSGKMRSRADSLERMLGERHAHSSPEAPILRSWTRCINEHGLDPEVCRQPALLTGAELAARQERLSDVIGCAKLEMATLYQQLGDTDLAVVLSDTNGVILHLVSSTSFAQQVEDWGFCVGAVWNEREAGTNGIGTCLAEGEAIAVRQHEHFFSRHAALTCSAAPVFDERGSIVAVLDVTSQSRLLQQHSLVLVGMSRQMIENRLLDVRHAQAHKLHFHSRPEFVNTLHAGRLTVDQSGIVLSANRSALFQLGFSALAEISGKHVTDFFNTSLVDIVARSIQSSFHPVALYHAHTSNRFFAVAQEPLEPSTLNDAGAPPRAVTAHSFTPRRHVEREPGSPRVEFGDSRLAHQFGIGERVIERGIAVFVHGETGAGKDVFAKALHAASARRDLPFVAINCASLPEHLVESELFGYRAGAFTGAQREGRRGKILQANGGTLFLDEIGDMPLSLQARLLRVLEEREVTPLGSESVVKVDFQLISASHRNLTELVANGQFREDLYYRLGGITLGVPSLRDREDKIALIQYLLEQDNESPPIPDAQAFAILTNYGWPGNVRQLRNVLRTAAALCDGPELTPAHLPADIVRCVNTSAEQVIRHVTTPIPENLLMREPVADDTPALNALLQAERDALVRMLDTHRWNVSEVASRLGVTRNTLYRKMRRIQIKR